MFAHVLHKMVENKEEGVPIHDCHFQHLFDTFAKMFGLQSDIRYAIVHVCMYTIDIDISGLITPFTYHYISSFEISDKSITV